MTDDFREREYRQMRGRAEQLDDHHITLRRWAGFALAVTVAGFMTATWVFDVAAIRDARWLIAASGGSCCVTLWLLSQLARLRAAATWLLAGMLVSPHADPSQSVQGVLDRHRRQ